MFERSKSLAPALSPPLKNRVISKYTVLIILEAPKPKRIRASSLRCLFLIAPVENVSIPTRMNPSELMKRRKSATCFPGDMKKGRMSP